MLTLPEEKTIAFGGVLIGIINAQLAARVKGTQNTKIDCPMPSASIAIIGTNTETKARFDISSVANMEIDMINNSRYI